MKRILFALFATALSLPAQDATADRGETKARAATAVVAVAAYPLDSCVVSDRKLNPAKTKTFEVAGRTYKTCCGRCQAKVEENPAAFSVKVDAAAVHAQLATYPLETCPISDRKLNDKSKNVMLDGTLVRVCCGRCAKQATAQPAALIARVRAAAVATQTKAYALQKCPVSGHGIDATNAVDTLVNGRLLRLCCEDCVDSVVKTPGKYLAAIDAAKSGDAGKADAERGAAKASGAAPSAGGCCSSGSASASCCSKPAAGSTTGGASCCSKPATGSTTGGASCCSKPAAGSTAGSASCCDEKATASAKKGPDSL